MIKEIKRHLLASIDETNSRIGDSTVRDSIKLKTSISTAKKIYSYIEELEKEAKETKETNNILAEADDIVNKQVRGHNNPVDDFHQYSKLISLLLNNSEKLAMSDGVVLPSVIAKVMITIKLIRESIYHKKDNLTDLCGYAQILHKIEENDTK